MEQLKLFEGFPEIKVGDQVVVREEYKEGLADEIDFDNFDSCDVDSVFTITEITKYAPSGNMDYTTNHGIIFYSNEVKRWNS